MGISNIGTLPVSYSFHSRPSSYPAQQAGEGASAAGATAAPQKNNVPPSLSEEEQQLVNKMKVRDREVRDHEMAHISASAGLQVSGPTYEYETGPDNQRYAIGGEVQIDVSPARTSEETIDKAERIRAAALAPPEPSVQDIKVATQATQMGQEARQELAQRRNTDSTYDPTSPQDQLGALLRQTFTPNDTGSIINTYA